MSSQFSSVEDFLRKAREAKTSQRPDVEEFITDHFEDPHLIAIPPDLGETVVNLTEKYGDEALRQIALFSMGKWFAVHTTYIEELMDDVLAGTLDPSPVFDKTVVELVAAAVGEAAVADGVVR